MYMLAEGLPSVEALVADACGVLGEDDAAFADALGAMQCLSLMLGRTWLENAGVASIRPLSPRVDTLLAAPCASYCCCCCC